MKIPLFNLKAQYDDLKEEIKREVNSVLDSLTFIMGPKVLEFEDNIAKFNNCKYAISCANGTDALVLSLRAIGIKMGDEVITTPYTFFATAEAISLVGATPVFVDVLEDTYNINPDKIQEKISNKTKAIMPVHIFGQPVKMDKIMEIAKRNNLFVVEDACQAIGSEYNGKMAGTIGDVGCFSFYPSKNLGACGDAGMIVTNNEKIAKALKGLRVHGGGVSGKEAYDILNKIGLNNENDGRDGNVENIENIENIENKQYIKNTLIIKANDSLKNKNDIFESENDIVNFEKYYNYLIGYNSRLDEIQAAILNVKLQKLKEWNLKKIEIANYYNTRLKETSLKIPKIINEAKSAYHLYCLCSNKRDELIKYLKSNGIDTGCYYPVPLHLQKAYEGLNYRVGDMPVSEELSKKMFAIPIYPELTELEQKYIMDCIINFERGK